MNELEDRIKQGRKAIALAKERGMDTSLWEKELARLEALAQAEEVARRIEELLASRGWCLWRSEVLGGEVIGVIDDDLASREIPQGHVIYTYSELCYLFGLDAPPMELSTLRLIHEAKRLVSAVVVRVENAGAADASATEVESNH
jgi:hypothetical protein